MTASDAIKLQLTIKYGSMMNAMLEYVSGDKSNFLEEEAMEMDALFERLQKHLNEKSRPWND